LPVPTGTITGASVIIDIQGVADVKNVTLNGIAQQLASGKKRHGHGEGDKHGHHGHHGHQDSGDQDNGQHGNDSDND
jgi:hypothetical protein